MDILEMPKLSDSEKRWAGLPPSHGNIFCTERKSYRSWGYIIVLPETPFKFSEQQKLSQFHIKTCPKWVFLGHPGVKRVKLHFLLQMTFKSWNFACYFTLEIWFCYSILTYFNIWLFKGHARSQMGLKRIKIFPSSHKRLLETETLYKFSANFVMVTSSFDIF